MMESEPEEDAVSPDKMDMEPAAIEVDFSALLDCCVDTANWPLALETLELVDITSSEGAGPDCVTNALDTREDVASLKLDESISWE